MSRIETSDGPVEVDTRSAAFERRARAVGITDGWPYGPNVHHQSRAELVDWAELKELRLSYRGRCLHWLAKGRCAVGFCRANHGTHRWMDHVTGWTKDGKAAVLVCQPYGITTDAVADLAKVAEEYQLHVLIHGTGWYGSGTTFIELRPEEATR